MPAMMERLVESLMQGANPNQACIDVCVKCAQICQECFDLCLKEMNVKSRAVCIKTLQDCAEICSTAACFMSRGSMHAKEICSVCITVCEKCAMECTMFQNLYCQTCAHVCKQCANECKNMINR